MNATGCILRVSFTPRGEFIVADLYDEAAIYFVYRDEQRHLLIVTERYLVGSGAFHNIAFGCQNLITNSLLGFGILS